MMKHLPLGLAVLCVALSAAAQIAMKLGMRPAEGVAATYLQALTSPLVWLGLGLYGLSAVAWLWVLSRLDVGLAYPLVSLGFVFTLAAGIVWLGEPFSWQRLGGCALIIAGVLLLATDA